MWTVLKYAYKVTKPRVQTINTKSLQAFRKQMYEARIRAHREAVIYLNKIEDQFLENHKQQMAQKHSNNQCSFRARIARNSYILYDNLEKNKSKHQQNVARMERYIRGEQIKRLNRDRIKKILEYESANFWLQGENMFEKFISDRVLPEYIGTTQYYHKLHSEALAYDELDFDLLHKLSSNQQSVDYKNKILIPLYKQVLALMREVKFTDEEKAQKEFSQLSIRLQNKYSKDEAKFKEHFEIARQEHEKKLGEIKEKQSTPAKKKTYFEAKLKNLILLLKKWKQYTDVLGMTSAQVLTIIEESKNEASISARKKQLQKEIEKKRDKTFVDALEEDTEEQEVVSLEKIIEKKKPDPTQNIYSDQEFQAELEKLLKRQENILEEISVEVKEKEEHLSKQSESLPNLTESVESTLVLEELKIDEGFLNPTETTTSIQVLKEHYGSDREIKVLLDIAGELTIEYPKLFTKIWETQVR